MERAYSPSACTISLNWPSPMRYPLHCGENSLTQRPKMAEIGMSTGVISPLHSPRVTFRKGQHRVGSSSACSRPRTTMWTGVWTDACRPPTRKPSGAVLELPRSRVQAGLQLTIGKLVGAIGFEPTTPCAQGRCDEAGTASTGNADSQNKGQTKWRMWMQMWTA